MKKIFTLLLSIFVVTMAMAQPMEGQFKKINGTAPEIDGVVDDVWATATAYNITRASGTPTLGEEGETTWQGMWNTEGVFILLKVTDDEYYPAYMIPTNNTWEYDKPELYFDVNASLVDGSGPNPNKAGYQGHHQFAPGFDVNKIDGTPTTDNGMIYAFKVDGSNYVAEYFIPYSRLTTNNNTEVDITGEIGFDAYILDRDPGTASRSAGVWSNDNPNGGGESWDNMDESGRVTFEGTEPGIDITKITISGDATITTDNGTIQFTTAIEPADATQAYKWVLTNETGTATLSKTGLLTGLRNGTVKVKAISVDEFTPSNEITVTISGQKISLAEINLIKNGNFNLGTDSKESWTGGGLASAVIEESYLNVECTPKTNIWDTMFGQPKLPVEDATTKYIVKFKAKASADMTVPVLMEDRSHDNNKTVTSSAPYRNESMWNVPVTTEEQVFEFDVIFSNKQDDSAYELNFQLGMLTGTFSITDIMMYKEADLALVDPTAGLNTVEGSSLNVYPNPVNNTLFVELKAINSKVAIYNSVGQKLMEKTATSNRVQFDVSALRKGMYIVRLNDGTSQKFVK